MRRTWTKEELVERWTLSPNELPLLANKTGATRLGFAVLLRFFAGQGRALSTKSALDARLLGGAALFGAGWGLSGFCPGPALTASLVTGLAPVFVFLAAMLAGMAVHGRVLWRPGAAATAPPSARTTGKPWEGNRRSEPEGENL